VLVEPAAKLRSEVLTTVFQSDAVLVFAMHRQGSVSSDSETA
jgi:hypothetical protein